MGKILRTRIAPTPSGYLHKGNLFSFLLTWLITRKAGGEILLRIDDLDRDRVRSSYIEDIFKSLDWLGIDYDLGPEGPEDFLKNYSQHKRMDLYEAHLNMLIKQPQMTFNCTCSRSQINALSSNGNYPGTCLTKGLPPEQAAIRIVTPEATTVSFQDGILGKVELALNRDIPHFIIRKKDHHPSYQLASLVDDIHFGINAVVRGADLISSTTAQIFLAQSLELPGFSSANFYHHPLVEKNQMKISKSQGHGGIERNLINRNSLLREFSEWIGIEPVSSINELLEAFDMGQLKDVGRSTD